MYLNKTNRTAAPRRSQGTTYTNFRVLYVHMKRTCCATLWVNIHSNKRGLTRRTHQIGL